MQLNDASDGQPLKIIEDIQIKSTMACGNGKFVVDINGDMAVVYDMQPPYEKV